MIVKANYHDIEQLIDVCKEFWLAGGPVAGFDYEHTERTLMNIMANNCIFIYKRYGTIQGMIILIFSNHLCVPEVNVAELAWYVRPEFRGGSAGMKLLKKAEEEAVNAGAKTLSMAYMEKSMPSVVKSIYEKLGFEFSEATYIKRFE